MKKPKNYYDIHICPEFHKVSIDVIMNKICKKFNIEEKILKAKTRNREIIIPRQLFCYFANKRTNCTLIEIGNRISKDHSTVISSINRINNMLQTKDQLYTSYINQYYE